MKMDEVRKVLEKMTPAQLDEIIRSAVHELLTHDPKGTVELLDDLMDTAVDAAGE
jgi:hypothetical protein